MTDREQIEAFAGEIDKVVERFEHEFNLSNVAAVGVLMLKVHMLLKHQIEPGEEED